MHVHPIVLGLVATMIAAIQAMCWIALGSRMLPRRETGPAAAAVALLAGTAATAEVLAVLCWMGRVPAALGALAAMDAVGLAVGGRRAARLVAGVAGVFARAFAGRRVAGGLAALLAVGCWLGALAPPRDADAMRYHLAHVQQIVAEGRWTAIPEYVYALPFGWTLNFIGFERLGVPQAAQMISLVAWVLGMAMALEWLERRDGEIRRIPALSLLTVGVVAVQPMLIRGATVVGADTFSMLVFATAALLASRPPRGVHAGVLLGFAAWVGAQSRYQLVAVGLAVTAMTGWDWLRRRLSAREAGGYVAGAAAAMVLALPFYLANWRWFGNPVWPLMVGRINGETNYRDRVMERVGAFLDGSHAPGDLAMGIARLLASPVAFPVAAMAVLACVAAPWSRDPRMRRVGAVGGMVLLLWAIMQPSLYSRFALMFAVLSAIGTATVVERLEHRPLRRAAGGALVAGLTCLAAVTVLTLVPAARFLATADEDTYHRATWYHPVYRWMNARLPPDARVLLLVDNGHSYYLRRQYRRADPFLSGEVDWEALRTPRELHALLTRRGYQYVVYDELDWRPFVGGSNMARLVSGAIDEGLLTPVRTFHVRLVTQRLTGASKPATVDVLRVAAPAAAPRALRMAHQARPAPGAAPRD